MSNLFTVIPHCKTIFSGILALSLAACTTVGPDYETAEHQPSKLSNIQNVEIGKRDAHWWRLFNDPMLNKLIEATLKSNYTLEAADANVREAFAIYDNYQTKDNIGGSVNATYNDAEQLISGILEEQTRINFANVGANLSWNLDLFGKIKRAQQASKADAQAAQYALIDLRVSLVAETALRYADYLNALMRTRVTQKNIDSLQQTRDVIAERAKEGFSSQLDLNRVDAELLGLKATLPTLTATAERARQALIVLTGNTLDIQISEQRDLNASYPSLMHPIAIGDPQNLLRQRADVANAEQQLIAATARIGVARGELYPDISISGFLGFITNDSFQFNSDSTAWSIAPTLSWNIFDLKSINAGIDIANARQQGALARFKQTITEALSEAEVSLSNYKATQQRQDLLKQQLKVSTRSLEISTAQFDEGVIDILSLLDVRRTKLSAEDSLVQAKSQNFSAMVDIYLSFGGGVSSKAKDAAL